ncbi:MAG TPA: alpha/beta hydrolase [Sphingomonas sp.]|uniref:alpha/beta fold hydrolase n=1 Tax=Sphingomonas sp. TaxID=28214 RepID=UPI002CF8A47C|nr:alpha/beta hydrolase [Sphingomonas sp.]HMI20709.1 alpha/beta hydrolase [Sphingomonas sp.]
MAGPGYEDGYWYSADGLRLHFRDYPGDAGRAPVLCIPGLTRNARDFEGVAARLAGKRRVIAVDLRGRGESDYSPDPYTYVPPVYLQDLGALIAEHCVGPVVVFGTSLGGLMAMLLSLTARPTLAGVLLNDVGPVLGAEGMARIRSYVGTDTCFASWDEAAQAIADNHAGAFPDYGIADWRIWAHRMCRAEDGAIRFDYDMGIAEPFKLPAPEPAFDLWPAFETLHGLPSVLIRGERSDVLEAETASDMVRRLPLMELVTLPRIGHAPTLEEPDAAAAIDRLLAKVDHE